MSEKYLRTAVGGSDIQVMLEFPTLFYEGQSTFLHMASCISVSYSVHRAKSNVYNVGQPILAGLAVGKKYVAGSMITVSFDLDELSEFINVHRNEAIRNKTPVNFNAPSFNGSAEERESFLSSFQGVSVNSTSRVTEEINNGNYGYKNIHTVMRDDLTDFNIHFIQADEYYGTERQRRIIVYGANFINNGQVMSIEDLVTENTLSFIARDVREQHYTSEQITSIPNYNSAGTLRASDLA